MMDEAEAHRLRKRMVEEQVAARGVDSPDVLAAMRTVPRHRFVPPERRHLSYRDRPLPLSHGQTISQPYIVAYMTQALGIGAGDKVLEIGTGSGYQAAVLAELCAEVYTIELVPELADGARDLLEELRYTNVHVRTGDGALGWPELAPFDGIIVTCGAAETPTTLLEQLAPGRHLILPEGPPGQVMTLRRWTRSADGADSSEDLMEVRFVPLVRP